ncbi:MAG: class I SAM-dependent methyltransferase [Bacteroidota bacterium]
MDEKRRWNAIAPTYNDEIFDVFANDKNGVLLRHFRKVANRQHTAIDFGCGNGKAFQYIAPNFKQLLGLDISQGLLNQAELLGYRNVRLAQKDLTLPTLKIPKADFLFCCNVAILSDVEMNNRLIKNARKCLKNKGKALFVIPSVESVLLSSWRLIDWYKKEGVNAEDIETDEISGFQPERYQLLQGLLNINGVLTKHYHAPEIEIVFARAGFAIDAIEKIEYSWKSEFAKPPAWMKAPYPWDWLVKVSPR